MQPIIHKSGAVGIPSGWEEVAAYYVASTPKAMLSRRVTDTFDYVGCDNERIDTGCYTDFRHDWRVLP